MLSLYQFIIDKKLYHPIFWLLFVFFWLVTYDGFNKEGVTVNLIYLMMSAAPVYFNSRVLMRRFLYKNQYFVYGALLIFTICFFSFLLWFCLKAYFNMRGIDMKGAMGWPYVLGPTLGAVSSTVLVLMIFEIVRNSIRTNKANKILEKEKLENELKYLKSQLNPHFLFNTLNNIYFLIQKDQDKAAEALAGFSEMLRYQLYECQVDKIPLTQEIQNVENYIRVASLSHDDISLNVSIDKNVNGEIITPLLLMPFLENAFKYVSNKSNQKKSINIELDIIDDLLNYKVTNTVNASQVKENTSGGIGLKNMERRLGIIYPNKYVLSFGNKDDSYSANLKLNL